jgi:formylglycine-generating enzyme required for sulfatase activity
LVDKIVRGFGVVEDVIVPIYDECPHIGRFPVTNLEYQRFVEAGGYTKSGLRKWWSAEGIEFWLHYAARVTHRFFGRREDATTIRTEDATIRSNMSANYLNFNQFGQPVTGISYFEAQAYCNWLSDKGIFGPRKVRLPTEAEWLGAALSENENFPWGKEPLSSTIANIVDKQDFSSAQLNLEAIDLDEIGRLNVPTTFGSFPGGVSHCGCQDMFGNVWEWLGDHVTEETALELSGDNFNVGKIAGHCCFDSAATINSRKSPIALRRPGYRHHVIGFRIAVE